jgi:serpin B
VHGAEPNTLISPYSQYTVMAMARVGARAETAAQLDAALRLDGPHAHGAAIAAIDAGIAAALLAAERATQPAWPDSSR